MTANTHNIPPNPAKITQKAFFLTHNNTQNPSIPTSLTHEFSQSPTYTISRRPIVQRHPIQSSYIPSMKKLFHIQNPLYLTKITLKFLHPTQKDLNFLSKALVSYFPSLQHLDLEIWTAQGLSDSNIATLCSSIKYIAPQLSYIRLFFFSRSELTNDILYTISTIFSRNCLNLKTLNLGFQHFYHREAIDTKPIYKGLKNGATNIENFQLSLPKAPELDLYQLSKSIRISLHKLTKIELLCEYITNVPESGFRMLSEALCGKTCSVEYLLLSLKGCNITDNAIKSFCLPLYKKKSKLKSLLLKLNSSAEVSDEAFLALSYAINSGMPDLEQLEIDCFMCNDITNFSIEVICEALCHIPGIIRTLQLRVLGCEKIDGGCFRTLGERISEGKFKALENLKLHFSQIEEDLLEVLSKGIKNGAKRLKRLELCIWDCRNMMDRDVIELSKAIREVSGTLVDLKIVFYELMNVSDEGMEGLSKAIGTEGLELEELNLKFSKCYRISDMGVLAVSGAVERKMKGLSDLSLGFSGSGMITREGVKGIGEVFSAEIRKLRNFDLSIGSCGKVRLEDMEELRKVIDERVKGLQPVNVNLVYA